MGVNVKKAKILIVEDSRITATLIENKLNKFGYIVPNIITSGNEVVDKVKDINPDLILMDIVLKGAIDGIETMEEIKKIVDVPVIYLTADNTEKVLERAQATAPYGYLIKPINSINLHTAVETALHRHRLELTVKRQNSELIEKQEEMLTIIKHSKNINNKFKKSSNKYDKEINSLKKEVNELLLKMGKPEKY